MTRKGQLHALVVDDERQVLALLLRALEENGYACDAALNGEEALQYMSKASYDLVVTDLRMPRMHGHALITRLLELEIVPVIVVVTAVADPRIVLDLYLRGVSEVSFKPVNIEILMAKIAALMHLRGDSGNIPSRDVRMVETSREIHRVTGDLQAQLKTIEQNFQSTIDSLKKQEAALEDSYLGSMRMLANLVEQVGVHTGSHAGRVESMVASLSPRCGIEGLELRGLKVAALTHEIGQFGLPDRIRSQPPWALTEDDRLAYERYPIIGAALLSQVPGSETISESVESHTENYDGSGFPEGKMGRDIPMGARIIRLADGLDTYMMHNHQGDNIKTEAAMDHMKTYRGTYYDPQLVDLALTTPEWFSFETAPIPVTEVSGSDLKAGMILAEDLFDSSGVFLGRKGITLHDVMLPRLRKVIGFSKVKVIIQ